MCTPPMIDRRFWMFTKLQNIKYVLWFVSWLYRVECTKWMHVFTGIICDFDQKTGVYHKDTKRVFSTKSNTEMYLTTVLIQRLKDVWPRIVIFSQQLNNLTRDPIVTCSFVIRLMPLVDVQRDEFWDLCLSAFAAFDIHSGCVYIDQKLCHMIETRNVHPKYEISIHEEVFDGGNFQFHPECIK